MGARILSVTSLPENHMTSIYRTSKRGARVTKRAEPKKQKVPKIAEPRYLDVVKFVDDYLGMLDWRVKENANIPFSFSSMFLQAAGETVARYTLSKVYPRKISQAHIEGDFHIHNLPWGIVGYCAGWSIKDLLLQGFGGVPGRTESSPARHFSSALLQISNFLGSIQNEWAGAQAVNSLDIYLAPFVRKDGLSYKQVKQAIQEFIYNLNISSRWGGQSPFTNVTLELKVPEDMGGQQIIYDGKVLDETYADFQPEADIINRAFLDVMLHGDMRGRIFTFPIPTYNVTKDFDWDSEVSNLLFQVTAKFGIPYFQNCVKGSIDPREIRAMCCRLMIDLKELHRRYGGFFGYADKTGCYDKKTEILTKNGWKFFKNLEKEDEILTLNPKTREIEFQKPVKLFEYDYDGEMIRISSKSLDLLVTPNHNVFVERATATTKGSRDKKVYYRKQVFCKADELRPGNDRIPKTGKWKCSIQNTFVLPGISFTKYGRQGRTPYQVIRKNLEIKMDDWLKFLGIYLAEGSVDNEKIAKSHGYRTIISQVNPEKREKIREMLKSLPFNFAETERGFEICNKQLWSYLKTLGGKYAKFVPTEFKQLPPEQLSSVLEWMVMGDGYKRRCRRFYWTTSKRLADDVQELLLKVGSNGQISIQPKKKSFIKGRKIYSERDCYLVSEHISKNYYLYSSIKGSYINKQNYKGKVYCCEVPNHIIYVRRNGKATFCGNSVGVVTINMPRLGYLSRDEGKFFERLERLMELAKDSLEIKRKLVEENMKRGLLPFSARYLGTLKFHFSTIGLIGMHEACLNFLGEGIETKAGKEFAIRVLKFMRERLVEFQDETGNIYNLEATPAEGTSHRLARLDKKRYPKIIAAGKKVPYYTNSTHLPVGYTNNLIEALRHQDDLQVLYNGGTILHGFLGEAVSSAEGCKALVRRIAENFRLPYYTITPTFSICMEHGYLRGEHFKCPHCGKPAEVYSRIVGYFRPVANWNQGKQEEFKDRLEYDEQISMKEI